MPMKQGVVEQAAADAVISVQKSVAFMNMATSPTLCMMNACKITRSLLAFGLGILTRVLSYVPLQACLTVQEDAST